MRLTVLGSGTSMGVPVIGCDCAVCASDDPRDKRSRTAALVEDGATRILIDTPPELRLQLLERCVDTVDAVLYTHEHADHVHGIDDLRIISVRRGSLLIYGSPELLDALRSRFGYIFDGFQLPDGTSKPQLELQPIEHGVPYRIGDVEVLPVRLDHGVMDVMGFRFGPIAYLTDVKSVPQAALEFLIGIEVLVVNALFEHRHPTHLSIPEAIELARVVGAKSTYLTHLTHSYAHADLSAKLPEGVEPAYDGLCVEL